MSDAMIISPVTVAVIDDNAEFGARIKLLLAKEEIEIHTAADGIEGIELVKQLLPDIVLLDIVLPGIDGIEDGFTDEFTGIVAYANRQDGKTFPY